MERKSSVNQGGHWPFSCGCCWDRNAASNEVSQKTAAAWLFGVAAHAAANGAQSTVDRVGEHALPVIVEQALPQLFGQVVAVVGPPLGLVVHPLLPLPVAKN